MLKVKESFVKISCLEILFLHSQKVRALEIIHHIDSLRLTRSVATLGIFDGVHLAHQEIIRRVKERSVEMDCPSVLLTLWPHPRKVLFPGQKIELLTTLEEKFEHIIPTGIDYMVILPFDLEMANTNYQAFIKKYVYEAIKAQYILIGYNHHFGKNREGSYESLKALGGQYQFTAERLEPYYVKEWKVSSSLIRKNLWEGNIRLAEELLGYAYHMDGKVVSGKRLGKKIGFPTANIQVNSEDKLVPAMGVYAVYIELLKDHSIHQGMMNIGKRPTVSSHQQEISIEVNIFDFDRDIYDQHIRVHFISRIRDEQKFESVDELKDQLHDDKKAALKELSEAHTNRLFGHE